MILENNEIIQWFEKYCNSYIYLRIWQHWVARSNTFTHCA